MILSAPFTRTAIGARPSRRLVPCIAAAASAASPGPGVLQYSGAGKSGGVSFGAAPGPAAAPAAATPGPGILTYTGAGKVGEVSFAAAPAATSVRERLAAAGLAGLVAYGLLNTLYYTGAFLLCWFTVSKAPSGQGVAAAAAAVAKTLAVVWAGSQVTKVPRAGAALLAVPAVDALLAFVRDRLRLGSKRDVSCFFFERRRRCFFPSFFSIHCPPPLQAFLKVIFPACIGVAVVLFGGVTLMWM